MEAAKGILGLIERPERRAADDRTHGMGAEQERGDDAEVAPSTAQCPEKVGVLVRARGNHTPVRQYHVGRDQIVDCQPAASREVAAAAAECQPAHTRGRDEAAGRGQAEGMRGVVDIAPGGTAFHADGATWRCPRGTVRVEGGAGPRIDANAAQAA